MQGNLLIKAVFVGVIWGVALSCTTKKSTVTMHAGEKEVSRTEQSRILQQVAVNQLQFTTFSGRAKSKITINQDDYDVTATIRMEQDKAIWISVTALMGIEIGRVLITPDSVNVINRLQSAYVSKPFGYLHEFTRGELSFSDLQQLLVGNVVDLQAAKRPELRINDQGYAIRGRRNEFAYSLQINADYRPTYIRLEDEIGNQQMETYYEDYQSYAEHEFPNHMKISIRANAWKLQSEMQFSRIVYDEPLDMPFRVPVKYKEIQ